MIDLLQKGFMYFPIDLCVDARAMYDAIAATHVCEPAESSFKLHLLSVRDSMIHGAIRALYWVDARNMLADGLTTGGIDRALLNGVRNACKYQTIHAALANTTQKKNQVGSAISLPTTEEVPEKEL